MIDVEGLCDALAGRLAVNLPGAIAAVNADGGVQLRTPNMLPAELDDAGDLYVGGAASRPPRFPAVEVSATRTTLSAFDLSHQGATGQVPVAVIAWDVDPVHPVLARRVWRWGRALMGALAPVPDLVAPWGTVTDITVDWGTTEIDPALRDGREPYVGWSIVGLSVLGATATGV
jgi:hypothetical protein